MGLTEKDYVRIRDVIPGASFAKPLNNPVFKFNLNSTQGRCIFLEGESCSIYSLRPLLCRLYPFQVGVKHDGKIVLCINHCPGVDRQDGELVDECYIENEILDVILELEGEGFIKKLHDYFMSVKKRVTPLLRTTNMIVYSDWKAKEILKKVILGFLNSRLLKDLTPWERLWCIYYSALPLLSSRIANQAGTLVTKRDVVQSYKWTMNQLNTALVESAFLRKKLREKLEKEGYILQYEKKEPAVAGSAGDEISIIDPMGNEFTVQTSKVLKAIPISEEAIRKEVNYLQEIVRREGIYGSVVCDLPVDMEIFILLRVANSLELIANAFAVKKRKNHVGLFEIVDAIRCVDGGLTDIVTSIVKEGHFV